jgi:hypothetical protein
MRPAAGMGRLPAQAGDLALTLGIHGCKAAFGWCLDLRLIAHDETLLLCERSIKHSKTVKKCH